MRTTEIDIKSNGELGQIDINRYMPECYIIVLRDNSSDRIPLFGRQYYDYADFTLLCRTPHSTAGKSDELIITCCSWILAFAPSFLPTCLSPYDTCPSSFLSYRPDEALHLSVREHSILIRYMNGICREVRHSSDKFSRTLLSKHIQCLLCQIARFYERQFITREIGNKRPLRQYETFLNRYIINRKLQTYGLPSVKSCADCVKLSPEYFCDLLKCETGKSPTEYIELKRIDTAKKKLLECKEPINKIAEELGYPSTNSFCRLFKKLTGYTPEKYRSLC